MNSSVGSVRIAAMPEPTGLTLRLLGEVEVARGGERLPLPASRKARALLTYLAATGRPHRRDRLCSMFWDVPDDPRGALRSTLSRLRAIVDEPERQRIIADRDSVRFDSSDIAVDLMAVRRLLSSGAAPASTAALESAAASFRGEFAEGLALTNCPDFEAWYMAEREETRRLQVQLLRTLIERHDTAPEAALPHARALVRVDPDAVFAHATLLRVLVASGRQREAEEQRDLSLRVLTQTSSAAGHELTLAWRSLAAHTSDAAPAHESEIATSTAGAVDVVGSAAPDVEPKPSILVLPFTPIGGQDYFSDGITEDIITDLSQISALSVVSHNTAFAFRGQAVDIGQVADKLKVGYVLEGSVRKADGRVRVTAQLVDVATGSHLWAERFDRVFGDLFVLQDDISQKVVAALRVKLLPDELTAITARPTENAQAYRYYLEARAKLAVSWSNKEYLRIARRLFAKAARLDPGYARAYAGMADCDAFAWASGDLDVSYEDMLANSSRALELAPRLAEAHASKGMALYVTGHPEEAMQALQSALELDTELFEAHFFYGLSCRDTGDFSSAALHHARAAELQRRNYQPLAMLADALMAMGRRNESESAARGCLDRIEQSFGRNPEVAEVLGIGAVALVCLGENERADSWVRRAMLLDPESYSVYYNAACTYAVIGKPAIAQKCLEYAFSQMPRARGWLLASAKHDAQLDSMRDQPDFQDFMQRLKAHVAGN
jgi:adenylate cyclase